MSRARAQNHELALLKWLFIAMASPLGGGIMEGRCRLSYKLLSHKPLGGASARRRISIKKARHQEACHLGAHVISSNREMLRVEIHGNHQVLSVAA